MWAHAGWTCLCRRSHMSRKPREALACRLTSPMIGMVLSPSPPIGCPMKSGGTWAVVSTEVRAMHLRGPVAKPLVRLALVQAPCYHGLGMGYLFSMSPLLGPCAFAEWDWVGASALRLEIVFASNGDPWITHESPPTPTLQWLNLI